MNIPFFSVILFVVYFRGPWEGPISVCDMGMKQALWRTWHKERMLYSREVIKLFYYFNGEIDLLTEYSVGSTLLWIVLNVGLSLWEKDAGWRHPSTYKLIGSSKAHFVVGKLYPKSFVNEENSSIIGYRFSPSPSLGILNDTLRHFNWLLHSIPPRYYRTTDWP